MRSLGRPDRIAAGAVGDPGSRRFFFVVEVDGVENWFLVEKQQAAALATRGMELLRSEHHEPGTAPASDLRDAEPPEAEFRVGTMAIGVDSDEPLVVITLAPVEDQPGEPVAFEATLDQLDGMVQAAMAAVVSGRPACPRCSLPIDPDGHACPASNGDLRRHRP